MDGGFYQRLGRLPIKVVGSGRASGIKLCLAIRQFVLDSGVSGQEGLEGLSDPRQHELN